MGKRIIMLCFLMNLPFIAAVCFILFWKTGNPETGERSGCMETKEREIVEKEIMEKEILEKEILEREIIEREIMERNMIQTEICSVSWCRRWEGEGDSRKWVTVVRIIRK